MYFCTLSGNYVVVYKIVGTVLTKPNIKIKMDDGKSFTKSNRDKWLLDHMDWNLHDNGQKYVSYAHPRVFCVIKVKKSCYYLPNRLNIHILHCTAMQSITLHLVQRILNVNLRGQRIVVRPRPFAL